MPKTDAQRRANAKYESKAYDKILIRVRRDDNRSRKDIQRAADAKGESLNQYILKAIDMRMASDN